MVLATPASQKKMTQVDNHNRMHMTKVQGKLGDSSLLMIIISALPIVKGCQENPCPTLPLPQALENPCLCLRKPLPQEIICRKFPY